MDLDPAAFDVDGLDGAGTDQVGPQVGIDVGLEGGFDAGSGKIAHVNVPG